MMPHVSKSSPESEHGRESTESKTCMRHFTFSASDGSGQLRVVIPEVVNPIYGMYVWPCAPVLAQYIWYHRDQIKGKRMLELGAGTALPGVVAAKCGALVTLSDTAGLPCCIDSSRRSCVANGLTDISVLDITWGQFGPDLFSLGSVDVILASDCFYDPKDFEDILVTVAYLLDKNEKTQFWCTYQERSSDWSIEDLLRRWHLDCVHVSLCTFDADDPELASWSVPAQHTIQMLLITKSL